MIIIDILVFIIGIVFGSFYNVCIWRIPRGESIVFPGSHCTTCGRELKAYELIPVLSWLIQKGKCKGCNEKISFIYPFIELLTGIIFTIVFIKFGLTVVSLKYIFLFSVLLISSVIDINTMEVYFKVSASGFIGGIIFSLIEILNGDNVLEKVLTIIVPLILMGGVYFISKRVDGFGLGDVEVYLFSSLFLDLKTILLGIFLSIIYGGLVAIVLMINGKRKSYIPFVPFISLGIFTAVIWGNELLSFYFNLIY